jgi:hypothetical protein
MAENILKQFGNIPVNYSALASVFKAYQSPKDKIAALQKSGDLLRLKKGLYLLPPVISGIKISRELIANHLYGPSYISMESALAHYGLIPERVYAVRSASLKRAKIFSTQFGTFDYVKVPENYFSLGIETVSDNNGVSFLLAAREKAVCDMIFATSGLRLQSAKAMGIYLTEDLRLDISAAKWDINLLKKIVKIGPKKTEFKLLTKVLTNEQ